MSNSVVLERLPAAAGTQQSTAYRLHLRQRVFIFFTRYGLIFSANLMVMLIGAVNYNNSLAYALIFLLSGLFLVAMLHTYSNLRGLIISASPAEAVFAGQQASFPLVFDNRRGNFRLAIDLQTQVRTKKHFRIKPYTQLTLLWILPHIPCTPLVLFWMRPVAVILFLVVLKFPRHGPSVYFVHGLTCKLTSVVLSTLNQREQ